MGQISVRHFLSTPDDTCAAACRLGPLLRPGDVLLFQGGIGAGKTHFARCLIKSILTEPEDVPSPTFTLVQTYDTIRGPVWHADLYRLSHPDEVEELGLSEAFDTAICLVEWPDRLGDLAPASALELSFSVEGETARAMTIRGDAAHWHDILREAKLD
ncbi:MAG: tRNA (adenosine(37)-N6)-threonylcarbamoyltransferase complex ATPase subunit type 1 TsaE [Pseudooceanicola sp.]